MDGSSSFAAPPWDRAVWEGYERRATVGLAGAAIQGGIRGRMQDEGPVTHPHPDDLTLYALGILAEPTRRGLEGHLRACAPCRRTVRALGRTASALALAAPPVRPPPRLRARVIAAARAAC